jgi:hypothetical protein
MSWRAANVAKQRHEKEHRHDRFEISDGGFVHWAHNDVAYPRLFMQPWMKGLGGSAAPAKLGGAGCGGLSRVCRWCGASALRSDNVVRRIRTMRRGLGSNSLAAVPPPATYASCVARPGWRAALAKVKPFWRRAVGQPWEGGLASPTLRSNHAILAAVSSHGGPSA